MQTLPPNYQNKQQIRDLFAETYCYRQIQQKEELKTLMQLFATYPRIVDTDNGRLVSTTLLTIKNVIFFFIRCFTLSDLGRISANVP